MAMRRLLALYNTTLARHPIATQATTSSILWGLGDCVAQKGAEARSELDTRRTGLTAAFGGCFMGPVGHHWYEYLDKAVAARVPPQAGASGRLRFILTKVAADTAVLGPLYVVAFFLFGAVAIDGSGWAGFTSKLQQDFVPTFVAQLAVWPAFQTLNFAKVPVQHQLLAVNTMTLLDASFLSWVRNQEDWVEHVRRKLLSSPAGRPPPT